MKGNLLASVCALSLLLAAPAAFAAGGTGMNSGAASMNGSGMNGGSTMHTPGAPGSMNGAGNGAGMGMNNGSAMPAEHGNGGMATGQPGMSHSTRSAQRHSYSRSPATSQEAEVDRLNEESLRAAQQNRAFTPGGADMGPGGMNQPGSAMPPGAGGGMQQPMQR